MNFFSDTGKVNLPICDVCNKPVDKIEWFERANKQDIFYCVYCHGRKEFTILEKALMISGKDIEMGVAFKKRLLSLPGEYVNLFENNIY